MTDQDQAMNESVNEEVTQPMEESGSEEGQTQQTQEQSASRKKDADYNWAEVRRSMAEKDRAIEELQRQISSLAAKGNPEDGDELTDEDIPSYKHVKKNTERTKKELRNELQGLKQELMEQKVRSQFPDYNDVVNPDSIRRFRELDPEMAYSLSKSDDPYALSVAVYKALKRMGADNDDVPMEKKRAEANLKKPMSISAVPKASTPLGAAGMSQNGFLSKERKSEIWKEMQEAMKGY